MKFSPSKKKLLALSCILGTFITSNGAAQQIDVSQQNREVNIMSSIFGAASVNESQNGTQFNIAHNPESFYLHDQGMVFSFNFLGSMGPRLGLNRIFSGPAGTASPAQMTFVNINEGFPGLQNAPSITGAGAFTLATEIVGSAPLAGATPIEGTIQSIVAGAPMLEVNSRLEELNASMREKQLELQVLQRSLLEHISEDNSVDGGNLTDVTASIAAIEIALAEDREAMRESSEQMRAEMAEQQAQKEKERNELNRLQANSILNTLCEYGATLKSLDNNENVTLIFKNINAGKSDLYVFSAQDVKRCSSVDKLLADGAQYQQ